VLYCSIAATPTRPILQKSPPAWHCQSKENKAATAKDKHDLENGEVLRQKAAIIEDKHDLENDEVLRQKFKDWEIELEG
jgi:hypothetical protein